MRIIILLAAGIVLLLVLLLRRAAARRRSSLTWQPRRMALAAYLVPYTALTILGYWLDSQPLLAGALVVWLVMLYALWENLPPDFARTTPGKAVWYHFIPIFAVYWFFNVHVGYASDYNGYANSIRDEYPSMPVLPRGLFIAYCILCILRLFTSVVANMVFSRPAVADTNYAMMIGILLVQLVIAELVLALLVMVKSISASNRIVKLYQLGGSLPLPRKPELVAKSRGSSSPLEAMTAAFGCIAQVVFLIMGLVQIAAIFAGLEDWLGLPWWISVPVFMIVAYIPVIGTVLGIIGAVRGWGWSVLASVALFGWPYMIYAVALAGSGLGNLFGRVTARLRRTTSASEDG